MTELFTGHCHLKVHLFKTGYSDSPIFERCLEKENESYVSVRLWLA
jgi:hypothetical protein